MRINVYAEELTKDTELVVKTADTGRKFYGVRLYLESCESLHHTAQDDDRSAITFWIPWTRRGGYDVDTLEGLIDWLKTRVYEARKQIEEGI